MFAISWDTVIVGGIVALLALYVLVQLVLRCNAMKLFEAWRLAQRENTRMRKSAKVNNSHRSSKRTPSPWRRVS
jgi:hypothetical protein